MISKKNNNIDKKTIEGFGDEWNMFDQSKLEGEELHQLFNNYFYIFPWSQLKPQSVGFDMGCGSGRWAKLVAPRVAVLHCIDPSSAINVAKRNLSDYDNCVFHEAAIDDNLLGEGTMDFGYSLGVLHHVPDTYRAIKECVRLLKPGAPFLIYLYYAFDNRSFGYRFLWRLSEILRLLVCRLPFQLRSFICNIIAAIVYFPLARLAAILESLGVSDNMVNSVPLNYYRKLSFYTMRTDSRDRFGTRLEKRFTQTEINFMMEKAGLKNIKFSEKAPYWCAIGSKSI